MADPQEPTIQKKVLDALAMSQGVALEESKGLPQEQIQCASMKIENFDELKAELDTELQAILERMDNLKLKIKANIYNEENLDGLLTR